jgi:hypothetical protein
VIADLDTLLTALYVELTDAELVCLAVAQVLLRYDDERHWLRAAPARVGRLFPRLLGQCEYNQRFKDAAPLMEAALQWLAEATPGSAEMLRLMDATPVPCGHSVITAKRSDLRVGRVRLLPQPFPPVPGSQATADLHLRRDGHRVRPGQPQALRGTRPSPADARTPAGQPASTRHRHRHR